MIAQKTWIPNRIEAITQMIQARERELDGIRSGDFLDRVQRPAGPFWRPILAAWATWGGCAFFAGAGFLVASRVVKSLAIMIH